MRPARASIPPSSDPSTLVVATNASVIPPRNMQAVSVAHFWRLGEQVSSSKAPVERAIVIITDSLTAARRAVNTSVHSGQAHSLAIVQALRGFFTNHSDRSIHFWDCFSKVQWSLHFLAHEDTTSTKIAARRYPATLLDALQSKSAVACLDAWRTSFARPSSQGRHFLPLKGGIKNLLQSSYAKGGGWLPFIGESVTLCARATRAILNHAPIGEFRQCFFSVEYIQCLCDHC